jgi:GT2 family glycosyltransferase
VDAVDVGVVTYNTRDLTVQALKEAVANLPAGARLLVHDNASGDGTADAIREQVPAAEVVAGDRNLGFAGGMNRLIARSTAPWFFALNSDAWPSPGALEAMLEAGARHPRAAAVVPRVVRPDGDLEHSTFPFPSLGVAAITAVGGYRRLWPRLSERLALIGAWDHDEPRDVDWAVGAAWLMRREAIDAVGGFDESFFMYAEDIEWCWRARRQGWTIRFEPAAEVRHVGNASGAAAFGSRRTQAHVHNALRLYRRTHGRVGTLAYRALSVAGYGRLYVLARARRDHAARHEWAQHVRAHLGRIPPADGRPT